MTSHDKPKPSVKDLVAGMVFLIFGLTLLIVPWMAFVYLTVRTVKYAWTGE